MPGLHDLELGYPAAGKKKKALPAPKAPKRILFVDDEESIRETLPEILRGAGFEVRVAKSAADAISEINSYQFDLLITDLNIGKDGDGFAVTSAMLQAQPNCVKLILTGYPAFETALQAIQSHVDDYLVKPVEVESLLEKVRKRLEHRDNSASFGLMRLAVLLKENGLEIVAQAVGAIKRYSRLSAMARSDDQLARHLRAFLKAIIEQLQRERDSLDPEVLRLASEHGQLRRTSGHSMMSLVNDFRFLEGAVYEVIENNSPSTDVVIFISDLRRFTLGLNLLMKVALEGFSERRTGKTTLA